MDTLAKAPVSTGNFEIRAKTAPTGNALPSSALADWLAATENHRNFLFC
jgi:hypothetical protein